MIRSLHWLVAAILVLLAVGSFAVADEARARLRIAWSDNLLTIEAPRDATPIPGGKLTVNYLVKRYERDFPEHLRLGGGEYGACTGWTPARPKCPVSRVKIPFRYWRGAL